jgi:hypothetical protein
MSKTEAAAAAEPDRRPTAKWPPKSDSRFKYQRAEADRPLNSGARIKNGAGAGRFPLPDNYDEIVGAGQEAWRRLKGNPRRKWKDWIAIGRAFHAGAQWAMNQSRTSKRRSRPYTEAYSAWLQMYDFDEIHPSVRADLLYVMERLKDIELWRDGLPEKERLSLNHPTTVARKYKDWKCPSRGNRGRGKRGGRVGANGAVAANGDSARDDGPDAGKFRVRCGQIIGFADIEEWTKRKEEPDQGLLDLAREAGEKLLAWVKHFEGEEAA